MTVLGIMTTLLLYADKWEQSNYKHKTNKLKAKTDVAKDDHKKNHLGIKHTNQL